MKKLALKTASVTIVLATLFFHLPAYADGGASRSPINTVGDGEAVSVEDGGIIDLNPTRNGVSTEAGYDSVTSINVDTSAGIIRGYAEYSLAENTTYSSVTEVGGSTVGGTLTLDTFLIGPSGSNTPDTVDVTVEMDFDGSFIINDGSPTLLLAGDIVATTINSLFPLNGTIYQSNLNFLSTIESPVANPVETIFASSKAPLSGGAGTDFEGASVSIESATLDELHAILSLTFPLAIGDSFMLNGVIIAGATASPDPANTDPLGVVDILAAEGAVDFSNTARMKIFLPDGYSLGGDDPLLENIVHTTVVPVLPSIWFLGSALFGLFGVNFYSKKSV